jgi:phage-related protein
MLNQALAYRGRCLIIEFALLPDEQMPAKEFIEGLSPGDQAKILALIERLGEYREIRNREKFKKIERTDFFEFKLFQVRVIGFFLQGRRFVLTHGFRKKQDNIPKSELERAYRIKEQCVNLRWGGLT